VDSERPSTALRHLTGGYARYVLALMVAINFLNYCDRWVGSAAAPLIQTEFRLSDFELGLLGTAFLLVYAIAAVPFGYWADRGVRKTVIGVGVAVWSAATVLSGFAQSYLQLFLTRTLLGIGEASYYPAGTSLVSDYFPAQTRGRVMSIWSAGTALGIAVGFAGGGYVAEHFGWRRAFLFAALPGLICALLAFTLREPLRGAAEKVGPRLDLRGEPRGFSQPAAHTHAEGDDPVADVPLLRPGLTGLLASHRAPSSLRHDRERGQPGLGGRHRPRRSGGDPARRDRWRSPQPP
jgi:MFS family permease